MKNKSKKAMIIAGSVVLSVATGVIIGCMKKKMMNKKNMIMEEM